MNWNDVFTYDNGLLRWRPGIKCTKQGAIAGSISKKLGYVTVRFKGVLYYAHRIIWEMHNGKIPDGMEIDHINHIRSDNRIENLRLTSRKQNSRNMSAKCTNSSGVPGVYWHKKAEKWCAIVAGKYIGLFVSIFDAEKAVIDYRKENGFHENHGVKNVSF